MYESLTKSVLRKNATVGDVLTWRARPDGC